MSINDRVIVRTEAFYADEFEKAQANRSAVVSYYWMNYANLAIIPVIAWILPADRAYFAILLLIAPFVGQAAGNSWLKKSVARPKIRNMKYLWAWEWAFIAAIILTWLAAMNRDMVGGDLSSHLGGFIGAVIGVTIAVIAVPIVSGWQRKRDLKRLEADAED